MIVLAGLLLSLWNCKSDNKAREALMESDIVQAVAKYYGFNLSPGSRLKGINKITLEGTQAFDANYFGFDGGTEYFLENGNKNRNHYMTVDDPEPTRTTSVYYSGPFADGTFPDQNAYTGAPYTVPVTDRTKTTYDKDGSVVTSGQTYTKWEVSYNSDTGYPSTYTKTPWDAETNAKQSGADTTVYNFTPWPEYPYKDYYESSYTVTDYSDDVTTAYRYTPTSSYTYPDFGYTENCYSDNFTTPGDNCGFSNNAVKIVYSSVYSGLNRTRTYSYYNTSDQEFKRSVYEYVYSNLALLHLSTYVYKSYDVNTNTGELTWDYQIDRTYTNNLLKSQTDYTAENTPGDAYTYGRDAQGRETDYLRKDSDGNTEWHKVYTFDSTGWKSSIREYSYTGGVQNDTPECDGSYEARDYSYARASSGIVTKTDINYCDGNTYQTDPYEKYITTYNSNGLQTSYEEYSYSSSTYTLTYKRTYEYDTNGNKTRSQYYTVSSGTATPSYHYIYEYDSGLFNVTQKPYDADGDLSTRPWVTNSKCTAGDECYTTTNYTYK